MKTGKTNWMIIIIIMVSTGFLGQIGMAQTTSKTIYGGKININGVAGDENTIGVYLAGEVGIGILSGSTTTTTDNKPIWFAGGYVGPSIDLGSSDLRLNLAGGYEQNLTYERGQYAALLGLSGETWSLEATKLWPTSQTLRAKYPGDFVLSGSLYPNAGTIGIGAFYQKEYQCTYIGVKLSIRIGNIGGSSSTRSTGFNCCGY